MSLSKTINRNSADVTQITNDSTVIESVQMRISAAAETHILDRLTDLYSDPLAAALRESMSNAMDATLLLPKHQRRPIEVTSPTPVAPFLVVRDFAQGMSTATVREVYSQYGVSTKAQDFTQTGAFGLGSKAPLAYCSEFNVETVHGGVRTSFAISRQGSGFFTKIHAVEETADPSGTKITIPVLMDDIPALKTLITRYQKFPSAADIVVNGDTTYESPYIELEHAFELDEDSGTVGRVWVLKNSLARALELRNSDLSRYDRYFSYALSGWEYEVPDAPYSRRNDADALFVFELKPGLVDFASARDKITNNARSAALTALCRSFIGDRTSTAVERYLQIVDQLSRSELTTFIRSAVGNKLFIVADDGKTFTLNQHNDNTSYPISKLSAADGYNPLALSLIHI